jgi:hypothetical protein
MASSRAQCVQQQAPLAPLPLPARLQGEALGLSFASALLLVVTGQLSKSFVMQHVHPSFRCLLGRARWNRGQENLRS